MKNKVQKLIEIVLGKIRQLFLCDEETKWREDFNRRLDRILRANRDCL
jgi:hypothetical protein